MALTCILPRLQYSRLFFVRPGTEVGVLLGPRGSSHNAVVIKFSSGSDIASVAVLDNSSVGKLGSYEVRRNPFNNELRVLQEAQASPQRLSLLSDPHRMMCFLLEEVKQEAEYFLCQPVQTAVITVPSETTRTQRKMIREGARMIAGLDVKEIINECEAAALAYHLNKGEDKSVAIYSQSTSVSRITILDIRSGVIEEKWTSIDTSTSGQVSVDVIVQQSLEKFRKLHNRELGGDMPLVRVQEAAGRANIELSSSEETSIRLPFLDGLNHLDLKLTREEVESKAKTLKGKTISLCKTAMEKAGITDISDTILIGDPTLPVVREALEEVTGCAPKWSADPEEDAILIGAVIRARALLGDSDLK